MAYRYHTEYCHVLIFFLLIFLGWVGVVGSRRLTTHGENYERSLIG